MFGLGWQEIAIVAVVLIIVVGPDDLPGLLRTIGRWIGSVQSMARDFRRQIDTMADDAGFAEERKMFDQVRNLNPTKLVKDAIDPTGEIEKDLQDTTQTAEDASLAARSQSALNQDLWKPTQTTGNSNSNSIESPKPAPTKAAAPKKTKTPKATSPSKAKPKGAKPKAAAKTKETNA